VDVGFGVRVGVSNGRRGVSVAEGVTEGVREGSGERAGTNVAVGGATRGVGVFFSVLIIAGRFVIKAPTIEPIVPIIAVQIAITTLGSSHTLFFREEDGFSFASEEGTLPILFLPDWLKA
jgi:hypothetical protein